MSKLSDAVLVKRCLAGDKAAFSALVTRHWGRVQRVLWALMPGQGDVDDLLQETFLEAYLSLHTLRQPDRFRAWACGIAVNLARRRLRILARPLFYWDELEGKETAVLDRRLSPEHVAEQREIAARLYQAIADLPPAEREAILLVYGNGLSHREAAARLNASLSAVKVRVHRGRRRLRAALEAEQDRPQPQAVRRSPLQQSIMEGLMLEVGIHDVLARPVEENSEDESEEKGVKQHYSRSQHRIVVLKEKDGERALPIWIGPYEADAIIIRLIGKSLVRPITYDLIKSLLDLGNVHIEKASVSRLHENIFYGALTVKTGKKRKTAEVDCRPSDAISLAARMGVPIYVAADVMDKVGIHPDEEGQYEIEGAYSLLDNYDPLGMKPCP